jgi:hypothetical protein
MHDQHGNWGEEPPQIDPMVAKAQWVERGDRAFDEEDYETALEAYHAATLLDGRDAKLWGSLGLAYSNLDLKKEAWRSFKLALQVNSEALATPLWYAGEFLYNVGDYPLAAVLISRYIEMERDPEYVAEARKLLAEAKSHFRGLDLGALESELAHGLQSPGAQPQVEEGETPQLVLDTSGAGSKVSSSLMGMWRGGTRDKGTATFSMSTSSNFAGTSSPAPGQGAAQAPPPGDDVEMGESAAPGEELVWDDAEHDGFIADLDLQLSGFTGKCSNCSLQIPRDAPYCYACKRPHFYNED